MYRTQQQIVEEYLRQAQQRSQQSKYGFNFRFNMDGTPDRKPEWKVPEGQKPALRIKSGKPLYQFEDIEFSLFADAKTIELSIPKLDLTEHFDLNAIIANAGKVSVGPFMPDEVKVLTIYRHVWEYLINNGLFCYPVEVLN